MNRIHREGEYLRVIGADWAEPLSGVYAQRLGGRWNRPGTRPTVYLNASVSVARANARHLLRNRTLAGMPFSFDDLEPTELPMLVATIVPACEVLDAVSAVGLAALGLPSTYPEHSDGSPVSWQVCQLIADSIDDTGVPGIACRSAAPGTTSDDEEFVWFPEVGSSLALAGPAQSFDEWFGDY